MRIVNQKVTVKSILFGRVAAFFYFLILAFFIYKCIQLLPIWLSTKYKSEQAMVDYNKKIYLAEQKNQYKENEKTDLGKERYQKDFFNKLDDGENLIILYDQKQENEDIASDEEERKMFWWEIMYQNYKVWWKNLEIVKR